MTPATVTVTVSAADAELLTAVSAHLAGDEGRTLAERSAWLAVALQLRSQLRGAQ